MLDTLQHAIVTLIAAGAAAVVVRHVFSIAKPTADAKCASCPSARSAPPPLADQPKPLSFIRSR